MTDTNLLDRVAELEEYTRRLIPAREGTDGWANYIQSCLLEERKYSHDVVAHALAMLRKRRNSKPSISWLMALRHSCARLLWMPTKTLFCESSSLRLRPRL